MLNGIKAELLKLRKDAMLFVGTFVVIAVSFFMIIKDLCFSVPPSDVMEWVMSGFLVNIMVLSVTSGFVVTNLVQREYQSGTIINLLTSSPSRTLLMVSKLIIWLLWYAVMLVFIVINMVFGSRLIYPVYFRMDVVKMIMEIFGRTGFLHFISSTPLLWITVLQKKLFYPSLLTSIGFTTLPVWWEGLIRRPG